MLKIETGIDNHILRTISESVRQDEIKKYHKLTKEMLKHIKDPENGWVWLAAPQVWVNKRIIVVSLLKDREDENFSTVLMINPEILEYSDDTEVDQEGCLSLPKEKGLVKRWHEIKLMYLDEKGNVKKIVLKWLSARIVQHEIDHLNGILFMDKVEEESRRFL